MTKSTKQSLARRREVLKSHLASHEKYCNTCTIRSREDFIALSIKLERIKSELLPKFNEVQEELEALDEDISERELFEDRYDKLVARLTTLMETSEYQTRVDSQSEASSAPPTSALSQSNLRLPDVQLPNFTGLFEEWVNFRDTFQSLIIDRPDVPKISKYYYLIGAISGDAKSMLEHLPISESNFDIAWQLLKSRYNNNRLLAQNHVRALFNLPHFSKNSPKSLRTLIDHFLTHVHALKALDLDNVPIRDLLLQNMLCSVLDEETLKDWEYASSPNQVSSLDQLLQFLEARCKVLDLTAQRSRESNPKASAKVTTVAASPNNESCPLCKSAHALYRCERFKKFSVDERWNFVKTNSLCFNCLKPFYASHVCSKGQCSKCGVKHHSTLHRDKARMVTAHLPSATPTAQARTPTSQNMASVATHIGTLTSTPRPVQSSSLLPTAEIWVKTASGRYVSAVALLDSGSDVNLITAQLAEKLKIPATPSNMSISGVNCQASFAKESVPLQIASRSGTWRAEITCVLVDQITTPLPVSTIDTSNWNLPTDITYADPKWYQSKAIQILLGADIFFRVLCSDQFTRSPDYPVIQDSLLGWIVAGRFPSEGIGSTVNQKATIATVVSKSQVQSQLENFWKIEELESRVRTSDEVLCEQHFSDTTTRDSTGRYIVKLPRKPDYKELGSSRNLALKRFLSLERRLSREPELRQDYVEFMGEYESLDHMQIASTDPTGEVYYIPHLAVLKAESSSTKLRVVYDASAKTSNGVSLNDTLLVGPCIQDQLFSIILRFRTHTIAFAADIAKMYRQILIHPQDRDLQRILWRNSPKEPLREYQLKTVTYGTGPAAFLSTRVLRQLADDEGHSCPRAATILKTDFYVDDLMSGCETEHDAVLLYQELNELLSRGGFELRKWSSNSNYLLAAIPQSDQETQALRDFGNTNESVVKTLGLFWNPQDDEFRIQAPIPSDRPGVRFTKRSMLSCIAAIFDPLGLISPIVITCKILFQSLWVENLDWDQRLPDHIHDPWIAIYQDLPAIAELSIPRLAKSASPPVCLQLHGFCDSSEKAYGACVYLLSRDATGHVTTRLLCSKSRVAPLKKISIPKLELCAALLLSKLLSRVRASLTILLDSIVLWSDSTIVLSWISAPSDRWKTFVANRVSEIQSLTQDCLWKHVSSRDNPADCISRGTAPSKLHCNALWWQGPTWLSDVSCLEDVQPVLTSVDLPETRLCHITIASTVFDEDLLQRYSSYPKTLRIVAYCRRFLHNCRSTSKLTGPLTSREIDDALITCVKITQLTCYRAELATLHNGQHVPTKSRIVDLNPFIHSDGTLRVGGRLQASELPFHSKHQMILPPNHFARKLIRHTHARLLHGGTNLIISDIRQRFWIPALRRLARSVVRACITCFRLTAQPPTQLMGSLPSARVRPAHPFLNVGVDYAGPYSIRHGGPRSKSTTKAYLAVFVCMATKAVHIEIATALSTAAFISAFTRFYCRRGIPAHIFSDNGSNFVGADRELRELFALFASPSFQHYVEHSASQLSIQWNFIPPRSPHFGGLWEACVKSLKFHLKRTLSSQLLSLEELTTIVVQVEAVLNSRPIAPLSEDPSDFSFLSPGHFLIGRALTALPTPDISDVPMKRLSRWQHLQRSAALLWKRWASEYLQTLQRRTKWKSESSNIRPGTLVILKDDDLPPLQWRLALVHETHPGSDGKVRVVTLRTVRGYVKRSISSICPLPVEPPCDQPLVHE